MQEIYSTTRNKFVHFAKLNWTRLTHRKNQKLNNSKVDSWKLQRLKVDAIIYNRWPEL